MAGRVQKESTGYFMCNSQQNGYLEDSFTKDACDNKGHLRFGADTDEHNRNGSSWLW